jgi:FAD/FMN-containing dehydrogenase
MKNLSITPNLGRFRTDNAAIAAPPVLDFDEPEVIDDLATGWGLLDMTDDTATFDGTAPLKEVQAALRAHDRMLLFVPRGDPWHTLQDAIRFSLGGQADQQPALADVITSFMVMSPTGRKIEVQHDHPSFAALLLSPAQLGEIRWVCLSTRPSQAADTLPEPSEAEPVTPTSTTPETSEAEREYNWTGLFAIGNRAKLIRPETVEALAEAVARSTGELRVVGSRYSRSDLLQTDGTLLELSRLTGLVEMTDSSATFLAGTCLKDVFSILLLHGMMLPCSPGVIAEQTLAGAVATGTHGQGMAQSSIADTIESFQVITARGDLLEIDRRHPAFNGFQLALGVLGIVVAIRVRIVPNVMYTCVKHTVSFEQLCEQYGAWHEDYSHVKAWWFTRERVAHVWLVNEANAPVCQSYLNNRCKPLAHGDRHVELNDTVARAKEQMSADTRDANLSNAQFRTVDRFRDFHDVTGNVYQILCKGIPARQINTEIAVPYGQTIATMHMLDELIQQQDLSLHYPIIMRSTGASEAWLSPAYNRPSTYFGTVVYTGADGAATEHGLRTVEQVEAALHAMDGRPHWGKYFNEALYDWRALYPYYDVFRQLHQQHDPNHRLANASMRRILKI